MRLALGCVMALAVAGSAAADANVIIVRDYGPVANCQALGEVRASSLWGGAVAQVGYDRAIRQLKERAAALGGTHVQIVDSASGQTGSRMLGTAYKCQPQTSAAEAPPTP